MPISIPDKARTSFDGNMNERQTVELPFPCPAFYVENGNPDFEELKNVKYFGGWACDAEKLQLASEHWKDAPFPIPGLHPIKFTKKTVTFSALTARSLTIAVIGIRQFSKKTDESTGREVRVAPFTKGARPGIQVLCVLGYRDENKVIHPWAPVMLTASGYQVNYVQEAIRSYRKAIKPFVKKLVADTNESILNLFWMPIGTFGDAKFESKGQGDKTNIITPIKSYIPDDLDEKKVENMYVGEGMAEFMSEISDQSKEWLAVFANMTKAPGVNQPAHVDADYDDMPPPPEDDSIPF